MKSSVELCLMASGIAGQGGQSLCVCVFKRHPTCLEGSYTGIKGCFTTQALTNLSLARPSWGCSHQKLLSDFEAYV